MIKRFLALVIIIALVCTTIYAIKVTIREREITSAIKHHLFVEKRYNSSEIKEIKVSYHLDSLIFGYDPYITSVVFSDESNTIYFYSFKGNKLVQSAMGGKSPGTKH